ncbi:hypothetical protein SAV31267_078550 [Streptomyces avermitilis]|nr:hypothetical protein SAV31267_078550 [Streptomyces avermitilis]
MDRIRGGDFPRDGTGDQRVGGQRKERTVLFEAADRKHGDLPDGPGPAFPDILRGVLRQQTGYRRLRS